MNRPHGANLARCPTNAPGLLSFARPLRAARDRPPLGDGRGFLFSCYSYAVAAFDQMHANLALILFNNDYQRTFKDWVAF
jgi:hypothetical protein